MTLLVLYFVLAISVSFICSLLEAVLLSINHAQVALLVEQGRRSGKILEELKTSINRPLSAILTVNTIANTVGAVGVGAQALTVFGSQWVALFSAGLTLSILVLSEIIPKTLGAVYWKHLCPMAAYLIRGLIYMTYPFVVAFELLGRMLSSRGPIIKVTREEMIVAAEMGRADGQWEDREKSVIKNLLRLNDVYVKDVMTPRSVVFALQEDLTVEEALRLHAPIRVSRIPIYRKDMDDITGLVRRYQINQAYSSGQAETQLKALVRPIHTIPSGKSVADVLDEFIQMREHLFLVVDEYGGTAGIISLEDAIETLLGVEIVDELDSIVDMQKYALEQWEKRKGTDNI